MRRGLLALKIAGLIAQVEKQWKQTLKEYEMTRSWKTTLAGILTIVVTLAKAALDFLGGQTPDITSTSIGLSAGIGLIAAKDNAN